jgi:hypothetical protein
LSGADGAQDFASAMETAYYVGAGMLAAGYLLANFLMPGGKQEISE